ncbi:MAG TPA: DUF4346 domain-containing protein [Chloroflexota bacterium]|nr:DUF4346 domain-containing protein [Chloroflexota bacterium]
MANEPPEDNRRSEERPAIVGDVVFGVMDSPVAVCTLGSRALLPDLAGRAEIAVAGRVFTENVGVERMIQNLAAFEIVRFLIVCGRETSHRVGETILALHRNGVDGDGRVIGSGAPEPMMPNLTSEQLRAFQTRIQVDDMIGTEDTVAIVERAAVLAKQPATDVGPGARSAQAGDQVDVVVATRDSAGSWEYDPIGYFLIFVDPSRRLLRVEHHTREHALRTVYEGRRAEELCHTIVRRADVTLLAHAAYLGRELAKAETALEFGLEYDQDRPLALSSVRRGATADGGEGGS